MQALRKTLLACGILSSALYVVADVTAARRYSGYSYRSQVVSELMAKGAPTRPFLVAMFVPYNLLLAAFGADVCASGGGKRTARAAGAMLAGDAAVGMAGLLVFEMDQRGAKATPRGALHGPVTGVLSLFIVLAMGFAAQLRGAAFRLYSYAMMLILAVFGGWVSMDAPRIAAGESTPGAGIKERVNIYAYLLWVGALAARLWADSSPERADR